MPRAERNARSVLATSPAYPFQGYESPRPATLQGRRQTLRTPPPLTTEVRDDHASTLRPFIRCPNLPLAGSVQLEVRLVVDTPWAIRRLRGAKPPRTGALTFHMYFLSYPYVGGLSVCLSSRVMVCEQLFRLRDNSAAKPPVVFECQHLLYRLSGPCCQHAQSQRGLGKQLVAWEHQFVCLQALVGMVAMWKLTVEQRMVKN